MPPNALKVFWGLYKVPHLCIFCLPPYIHPTIHLDPLLLVAPFATQILWCNSVHVIQTASQSAVKCSATASNAKYRWLQQSAGEQGGGWQSIRMHWDPLLAPFATRLLFNGNPVILSPAPLPSTLRLRYHYFISSLAILSLAQPSTIQLFMFYIWSVKIPMLFSNLMKIFVNLLNVSVPSPNF